MTIMAIFFFVLLQCKNVQFDYVNRDSNEYRKKMQVVEEEYLLQLEGTEFQRTGTTKDLGKIE